MVMCREQFGKSVDKAVFPGMQGGPLMHVIAAKAVAFQEALQPSFNDYQEQIVNNAKALAGSLLKRDFRLVSGGTDTHLILVDLTNRGITGKDMEIALDKAGITVNKNTVPAETRSPFVTSGIRIGTPAVTTRGFKEAEMDILAGWIEITANNIGNDKVLSAVRAEVLELCSNFPLYKGY